MGFYYAVRNGRVPGIYDTWNECKRNTDGFKGAQFHKFKTFEEAKEYMYGDKCSIHNKNYSRNDTNKNKSKNLEIKYPCAFVDGSYNIRTKECGYGVVFKESDKDTQIEFKNICLDKELYSMRNVYGEISGCMEAITHAIYKGLNEINIYYDYTGIEKWANHEWKTKIDFIKSYIKFIDECREGKIGDYAGSNFKNPLDKKMTINFHKVDAHTGVELNERADTLAKEAVRNI